MNDGINVFILAAGLGERLRPMTDHIPKPLMPVLGRPALQYVLDNVSLLPFNKIGINLHHKKEAIEQWVSQCAIKEKIVLFPESTILGTGGALKNAEGFLREGTFLVHNSDILSDINLEKLLEHHLSSRNIVTLAVHDYTQFNTLSIDEEGFLRAVDVKTLSGQSLAFTGIAVYKPDFLRFLPEGASGVVDAWLNAVSAGYKIGIMDVTGCCWSDIGTPSAYASAVFDALRNEGEVIFIHASIKECNDIELEGHVVIEKGCKLNKGVSLRNCIVLPHSCIETGAIHELPLRENCIIGPDFIVEIPEAVILNFEENERQPIGTGGSDRKYFRVRKDNESVVLMQCSRDDPDFERQMEYTRFFMKHGVPVPRLIQEEPEKREAVFEDAGDISLYSHLKCPRGKREIAGIYEKVIDALVQMHLQAAGHIAECPALQERIFDYDHFRWETDYFIERFVEGISDIRTGNNSGLYEEFHQLALRADSFLKTVIHRDFQSQNIMIMKGQEIRIIDYQGARLGPPAYDVVSILWDPYYRLEDDMREELLLYYMDKMAKGIIPPHPPLKRGGMEHFHKGENTGKRFDRKYFIDTLLTCRLQRHMQALGAYGFLSSVKGKGHFLKHVPEGLRLLREDLAEAGDLYPELYKLVKAVDRSQ